MPPHDKVHAPDGRTWYETAIAEAEKRGKMQDALRAIAHMEAGSRGAYKKFYDATQIAQKALDDWL